ncbi:HsdM family class I SAM-dependent methyltransferase [Fretibacterium fastidiosum]|uniref:site-specific DNA-methyltransferase (adenine-specific) n=1 Tax=Fretibacterium fastidiosum TaxID=651822 RepID=A0AB94IWZ6_9BACT|nr:N-6 DNA methylase [Fretibacterium fastidiosum]CBL28228.1 Type I restriction-modification system methyltransferase subunit [Fretibacterium fastidiosum]
MAKKEVRTDLWVAKQLDECGINFDAQGSNIKEINEALKTASKRGTGNVGYPEYVAVIGDFVLVIEDKADTDKQLKLTDKKIIDTDTKSITEYAVNGAYFYGKHIAQNSSFKKVFALGVSGDEKHHVITPLYVDDREGYKQLPDIESFVWFSPSNIGEYYTRYVLEEATDVEKTTEQILKDAAELHEYLRTYGTLKDQDKPLVVAGILLALDEVKHEEFKIDNLTGSQVDKNHDGDKLMKAINTRLTRSNVGPDAKKDKLLSEFSILNTSFRLNEVNDVLGKTPLKFYTKFLYDRVFRNIKYQKTSEDFIGRFYGEFMSYSGGDGQTLGIILTPRHITDLMCDLVDVQVNDVVLDPTCGTAGFLISAMHKMLSMSDSDAQRKDIKKKQLHGFELQSNMFAVAAANMILRHDGNSNLECTDFLKKNPAQVQMKGATIGLMNPPYSQGTKADPSQYELSFVEHLLDSLTEGGRAAVIVPQSSMTGKSAEEKVFKESILKNHTLEGVITCNTETFYGVGTNPVIALFTAHEPHPEDKVCKFIDFRNDGFETRAHVGLVEGDSAKDKKQHLLDVWNGRIEAPSKFCVKTTVEASDEWLHSFYYFNDEIPTDADFEKTIGDYLTFEFSMVMQNREYLFEDTKGRDDDELGDYVEIPSLEEKEWEAFSVDSLFPTIEPTKGKTTSGLVDGEGLPYIAAAKSIIGCQICSKVANNEWASKGNGMVFVQLGDGAAGLAHYVPMPFVGMSGKTSVGYSKHQNLYNGLFIARCLSSNKAIFSHGHSWTGRRLTKTKVMLPVNNDGEPDYDYMEQYSKNMMLHKYKQYLRFIDGKGQ